MLVVGPCLASPSLPPSPPFLSLQQTRACKHACARAGHQAWEQWPRPGEALERVRLREGRPRRQVGRSLRGGGGHGEREGGGEGGGRRQKVCRSRACSACTGTWWSPPTGLLGCGSTCRLFCLGSAVARAGGHAATGGPAGGPAAAAAAAKHKPAGGSHCSATWHTATAAGAAQQGRATEQGRFTSCIGVFFCQSSFYI